MKKIVVLSILSITPFCMNGFDREFIAKVKNLLPLHKTKIEVIANELDNYEKLLTAEYKRLKISPQQSSNSEAYISELKDLIKDAKTKLNKEICDGITDEIYTDWKVL